MQNFTFIRCLDVYDLACSMRSRVGLLAGKEVRRLMLRGPKKDAVDPDDVAAYVRPRDAAKWVELKIMLGQVEQIAETIANGPVEFGRISIEWLDPGAIIGWRRTEGAYAQRFWRLHLPLRTNPGAMVYSGVEAVQILPGQLTQVNVLVPHSAINLGDAPRVHLLIDVAKAVVNTLGSIENDRPDPA